MTIAIIITAINVILSCVNIVLAFRVRNIVREDDKIIVKLITDNIDIMRDNRRIKRQFKSELYNGAFAEWEIVEDTEGKRDFYLEKDGIRLIFDDKKCIGWYRPNTYEAPSAEVVN